MFRPTADFPPKPGQLNVLLLLALVLTACAKAPPAPEPSSATEKSNSPKNLRLGAILFDLPFAHSAEEGMREALPPGVSLTVKYHSGDVIKESEMTRDFIGLIDVLLIAPEDPDGSVSAIKQAHDAGIRVVCLDGCLNPEDTALYTRAFFQSDPTLLGYRTGVYLAEWIDLRFPNETVDIGVLDRCLGTELRVTAFRAALRDNGAKWREVAEQQAYLVETARIMTRKILEEKPEIRVWWACNEGATEGSVLAVRELGLQGQVFVFGTDINKNLAAMLRDEDDVLQAVTGQDPVEIGRQAVLGAIAVAHGEPVQSYRTIDIKFYSRDEPERIPVYVDD